jgi:SWI/SNF-related matrix-associated actin-dependent regulator 1 of chromatin subfamily A
MSPLEVVQQHYRFPDWLVPFPAQVDTINSLGDLECQGHWLDMGVGKTFTATAVALYLKITRKLPTLVIMPPILLRQWAAWLAQISPKLRVTLYKGTPKQRDELSLDADFVLVGIQIFKRDHARFQQQFLGRDFFTIVDEATEIAWITSKQHEMVYDFILGQPRAMLTGTPANKPLDTYGLMKFSAPQVYRNYKHFCNLHVESFDMFKNPETYRDLDDMKRKLLTNAKRYLYEDVHKDAITPLFVPIKYDLDPEHHKLYTRLAETEILQLGEGKIDATNENKLIHALGQIVLNWGVFAGDPSLVSETVGLVEQKLKELNGKKLVVFANYKMSVKLLVEHFGAVCAGGINGDATQGQKDRSIEAFINDPTKTLLVVQVRSGGKGLDGLQHVCHHCMFIEPCTAPRDFHQAVARLKRTGQRYKVMVMIAIANGTLQRDKFKSLLDNDTLINKVVRNAVELRALIYGK